MSEEYENLRISLAESAAIYGLQSLIKNDSPVKGFIDLDGMAVCNLLEPSEGDLERIYKAYSKTFNDLRMVRESQERQRQLNDTQSAKISALEGKLEKAEELLDLADDLIDHALVNAMTEGNANDWKNDYDLYLAKQVKGEA